MRNWSYLPLLLGLAWTPSNGQPLARHVTITELSPADRAFEEVRLLGLTRLLEYLDVGHLRPLAPGSWEASIVAANIESLPSILHGGAGGLTGHATFTTNEGDILLARWAPTTINNAGAIWLWDAPDVSQFILEVEPEVLQPGRIVDFLDGLLVWTGRTYPRSLLVRYIADTPGKERIVSTAVGPPKLDLGNMGWTLLAVNQGGRAYVSIGITKYYLNSYPSGAGGVKERFPPLATRLAGLSRAALLAKYRELPIPVSRGDGYRAVILKELFTRGPVSDEELRLILFGKPEPPASGRWEIELNQMTTLLWVLEDTRQFSTYAAALQRMCLEIREPDPVWNAPAVGHVFNAMKRNGLDFTEMAVQLIESGRIVPTAARHLSESSDPEVAKRLERVRVEPQDKALVEGVIRSIRQRASEKAEKAGSPSRN